MKGYRLNKKYIIKMMVFRITILFVINMIYIRYHNRIPIRFRKYVFIGLYIINILGFLIALILPFIEYLAYKYYIYDEFVEIRRGVIFRRAVYIPVENVKYVIIVKDPLDNLLGINNLKLYTTAGHRIIKAIDDEKAKVLWNIMKEDLKGK